MQPGVTQLGYLGFQVRDLAAWERFATQILGLGVSRRLDDGGLALRLDGHEQRFFLEPGEADDLAFVGWELPDLAALEATAGRLRSAGVAVEDAGASAATRRVERLLRFRDPAGIPCELFFGPALAAEPFRSPVVRSGFVADEQGLGHLVLSARSRAESEEFYTRLLGFRLSDRIVADVFGCKADITFLHANARHHSLALSEGHRKRLHHFMIEARSMDEVGLCFDRALRAGVPIVLTPGRHPNDRMYSFYAQTPSGFEFEFGWGGREVDDATWEPTTYERISEWGHHPPALLLKRLSKQLEKPQ
jgi:2,3-dihydroxybiphenyl 1,2-dioxygenase